MVQWCNFRVSKRIRTDLPQRFVEWATGLELVFNNGNRGNWARYARGQPALRPVDKGAKESWRNTAEWLVLLGHKIPTAMKIVLSLLLAAIPDIALVFSDDERKPGSAAKSRRSITTEVGEWDFGPQIGVAATPIDLRFDGAHFPGRQSPGSYPIRRPDRRL